MDFYAETPVKKTRKAHRCSGCGTQIEVGSEAIRYSGASYGDFYSHIHHPECRKAEIALNRLHGVHDGEDWMALTDMEADDWPWLLDEYPAIAERMGVTAEKIAEREEEQKRMHAFWMEEARKRAAARKEGSAK